MSTCSYPGCRRNADVTYQAIPSLDGTLGEEFDLCTPHLCHGDKTVLRTLGTELQRDKFRKIMTKASLEKKSDEVKEVLKTNKEALTLLNYQEKTGKRFRMTKNQTMRKISREEAFNELMKEV